MTIFYLSIKISPSFYLKLKKKLLFLNIFGLSQRRYYGMLHFIECNKLLYCGKIDYWDENDCYEIVSGGERIAANLNWDEEGIDKILVWWHLQLRVQYFFYLLALYVKTIFIIECSGSTSAIVINVINFWQKFCTWLLLWHNET